MQTNIHIKGMVLVVALIWSIAMAQQTVDPKPSLDPNPPPATATATPTPTPPPPTPTPTPLKCEFVKDKPTPVEQSLHFGTCILARMAPMYSMNGKYLNLVNGTVNTQLSRCDTDTIEPMLVVDFPCGQLSLTMSKSTDNNVTQVFVRSIDGRYQNGDVTGVFSNTTKMFVTSDIKHYYKCDSEQPIASSDKNSELYLSKFAYETYRGDSKEVKYVKVAEQCALDSGSFSYGVRIGVGICLVGFVLIILVAYFVGRRRWSQRSSYESV